MIAKGIIKKFIVMVNPAIFGYEKQCFLVIRNIDKIITKEKDYVYPICAAKLAPLLSS
ncbi:MAG: hypothetical protein WB988_06760 [Candidatus Nitrosopolaris sp.]